LVALSGGKDSTYALCKMVELGAKPLAITLDPGYLSDIARENISRVTRALRVEHRYLTTPVMKEIFVDSLKRHSNVCNGCFKTLYTLSVNLALELNVGCIVTGLSRGQLFETRLSYLYKTDTYDEERIEHDILQARLIYHRMDDAVSRLLDTRCFQDSALFGKVRFLDFYRYVDVSVDEVYRYLQSEVGWTRPGDTGRSTNCLINNTGIFVHNAERGYHNYSLPYSWDVRLGHKSREAAMRELDDVAEIDSAEVTQILEQIGYEPDPARSEQEEQHLVGYYVASTELSPPALREYLQPRLPEHMIPAYFVRLDRIPLTANGKVNRRALPAPLARPRMLGNEYLAPSTETEKALARIWSEVLRIQRIGVHDDFFALGGNSLPAALVLLRIAQSFEVVISISEFGSMRTVAQLAAYVQIQRDAPRSNGAEP
jgi:acyl carrier protein